MIMAVEVNEERWWDGEYEIVVAARWCVCKCEPGLGLKTQNGAAVAWFQVFHVKWQQKVVKGGDGVAYTSQW